MVLPSAASWVRARNLEQALKSGENTTETNGRVACFDGGTTQDAFLRLDEFMWVSSRPRIQASY